MALTHRLHTTTRLALPRSEVFDFFSDAENLERITPPELDFEITTPRPIEIGEGALIDYRLGLFGVRFGWRTEIVRWEPPYRFVDQQVRGPYRRWHHTHSFVEVEGPGGAATRMDDEVLWELPLSPAGELAYPLVRAQLARIFGYRQRAIRELLGGA
ncbi:SRPBCC family protein [Rubrivirga sp. S365]|uniref:SRPBCC family protein n=1 Tax=Rubrivirga sp. S365 TaxID=3076080 RepID=UPI0028C62EED|nr:SRPBCC family protein [Rubrivirga sp. S365]MDT7856403.1 SRPBCC family protein [Rubrivirga sp. S365]